MCGIVVLKGDVPAHVRAMAIAGAAARGPHTHGWAYMNEEGWDVHRYPGRLSWATCPAVTAIHMKDIYIGHSRLATSGRRAGDAPPVLESQPYVSLGDFLLAHNGTAPEMIHEPGEVDSMALLHLYAAGGDPAPPLRRSGRPQACVWAARSRVAALRVDGATARAHPLFLARGRGWTALSSGLIPGGKLLPAGKVIAVC